MCFEVFRHTPGLYTISHYIMRGQYDDILQWPFIGKVTVEATSQSSDYHYYNEYDYGQAFDGEGDRVTGDNDDGNGGGPAYESRYPDLYWDDDTIEFVVKPLF